MHALPRFAAACGTACLLAACSVVSSEHLNTEAAHEYRQIIGKAQQTQQLDQHSPTAQRIRAVFNRLVPQADRVNATGRPFRWELAVIRSDELNAWAMPGGKMAVYTGLVEQLNLNDDEIAAIIGHEMTHALLEHSKQESNRNLGIGLAAQIGGSLLQAATGVDGELIHTGLGLAADLGAAKPFSRKAEREADLGGLRLMARAGFNPEAAVSVWQKMNATENNNHLLAKILSTHPTNNDRIKIIRNELPNVMPIYRQAIGQN